jgi:protein phosphatase 1 regulatory subunit 37
MSTEAAIAFAEGLHEAGHILHIDLTGNPAIDADGVAALTVGMRANGIIRCLDMTLQHADKSQAELAQSLMQCCIRNTETAVKARGEKISQAVQDAMWSPIQNSTLVRQAKEYETLRNMEAVRKTVDTPAGLARNEVYELDPNAVLHACEEVAEYLHKFVAQYATGVVNPTERQRAIGAVEQAKALLERVGDLIQDTEDAIRMERLLAVNDLLAPLIIGAEDILTAARRSTAVQTTLPSAQRPTGPLMSRPPSSGPASRRHMRVPSLEISSPNFSITNSDDDDSDAEELASAGGIAPVKQTTPANLPAIKKKPIDLNGLSLGILNARTRLEPSMSESSPGSTVLPPDVQVHTYETPPSPLERVNKDWLEEEGEIFRKGFKLRVAEEIEERDDKLESGSDLKQKVRRWQQLGCIVKIGLSLLSQILEIEVARTPHRPVEHALQHDDDDTSDSDDD